MKTKIAIFTILLLVVISFIGGWFTNNYFKKPKIIIKRDSILVVDTLLKPVKIDTIKLVRKIRSRIKKKLYREIKTTLKPDTVIKKVYVPIFYSEIIRTQFSYSNEAVRIRAIAMAKCRVDSIQFKVTLNQDFLNKNKSTIVERYPWYKKAAFATVGVLIGLSFVELSKW